MRTTLRCAALASLMALCYLLGRFQVFELAPAAAQVAAPKAETLDGKIKKANQDLRLLQDELVRDGRYKPAINGINAFAVTVGGVDAVADLDAGRGVDPETFAGLYAGQATSAVALKLKKDDNGRLLYNGRIVRMYSLARLKDLWRQRAQLSDASKTIPGVGTTNP